MELVNIISNSPNVLRKLPQGYVKEKRLEPQSDDPVEKILRMFWDTERDVFIYKTNRERIGAKMLDPKYCPTKREILSAVMRIYDPLGLISCFVVRAKIMIQNTWRDGIKWDDKISKDSHADWIDWVNQLGRLENIEIPRCYLPKWFDDFDYFKSHTFVDASEIAFAAVVYFRFIRGADVHVVLVTSKSRVTPIKTLSCPKRELQSVVMGSRLMNFVEREHSIKPSRKFFWLDSSVVEGWIKSKKREYQQFVSLRVGEILATSTQAEWRHIPGKQMLPTKQLNGKRLQLITIRDGSTVI